MTPVKEICEWLSGLPEGSSVGVDEGGLALAAVSGCEIVEKLEIGGIPEAIENEDYRYTIDMWREQVSGGSTLDSYEDWVGSMVAEERREAGGLWGSIPTRKE